MTEIPNDDGDTLAKVEMQPDGAARLTLGVGAYQFTELSIPQRKALALALDPDLATHAKAWRGLRRIAGYHQDSSDQHVELMQDDATRECILRVGTGAVRRYSSGDFLGAVAKAVAAGEGVS